MGDHLDNSSAIAADLHSFGPGYLLTGNEPLSDSASQAFGLCIRWWQQRKAYTKVKLCMLLDIWKRQTQDQRDLINQQFPALLLQRLLESSLLTYCDTKDDNPRHSEARARSVHELLKALKERFTLTEISLECDDSKQYLEFIQVETVRAYSTKLFVPPLKHVVTRYFSESPSPTESVCIPGLWLEFGVDTGKTVELMAQHLRQEVAHGAVFGFDSFEGLPEDWRPGFDRGCFKRDGGCPPSLSSDVAGKVVLVKGLFQDTLPSFLDEHPEPVSLLHLDSDLYSSASFVLSELLNRSRIQIGTVIVFDELFNYCGFEQGELRAWFEVVSRFSLRYRWLGIKQICKEQVLAAAVVITGLGEKTSGSELPCKEHHVVSARPLISHSGLRLLGKPLPGKDKYNGGVTGADGCIYGIPADANEVLQICPDTQDVTTVGWVLADAKQKWLRGCLAHDNCVYGIPCCAETVLKIDTDPSHSKHPQQPTMSLLEPTRDAAENLKGTWKWHGGVVARDGNIYGVPANATSVLKISVPSGEVTTFGDASLLEGDYKWYGGLLAADGAIYCIPQNADAVLKILPEAEEVVLIGQGLFGRGDWKWHGCTFSPRDQCIYGIPNHGDTCLRIDPAGNGGEGEVTLFEAAEPIESGAHRRGDGKYKYEGAVLGGDENIYCIPGDADYVLKIVPPRAGSGEQPTAHRIGPSFAGESKCNNKWQNGFLGADGCIYAVPHKAEGVLRIDPSRDTATSIQPESGPLVGRDKWQSGALGHDGCFYCTPFLAKDVLKIDPVQLEQEFGQHGGSNGMRSCCDNFEGLSSIMTSALGL
ncbi:hypothetical protein CYMTET_38440 [Cymbomonas tetramitiformis]|uniref:Uncharacterized protein n=1 Tax=Cymbomonas tetramitiformis TaxID=36881 RepID=A0AAE0F589_9CHLO|nr:hypothetical protein CYMTET_38440 [Cymbomonas tetramitiformis]